MATFHRYPEDPTGQNPDNLVSGEVYNLSERPIRVAVPVYGPFFVDSLIVYDQLTQQPLTKNVDYRVPTISQELTLRYGKAVADAILIENSAVSAQIKLRYQALGGDAQNRTQTIAAMYETWLNDNRSVDWTTGVYGKPAEFPTGPHPHWLSEIFGFEPLTFQLERLAQAIMIGATPAFENLLDILRNKTVSEYEIDRAEPLDKYVTFDKLLYAATRLNFNTIFLVPESDRLANGGSLWFNVQTTNTPQNHTYFWTIEHDTTDENDFVANSGVLNLSGGKGQIMVQALLTEEREESERFRLALRSHSPSGGIVAMSDYVSMAAHAARYRDRLLEAMRISCLNSPRLKRTAKVHAVNRKLWTSSFQ